MPQKKDLQQQLFACLDHWSPLDTLNPCCVGKIQLSKLKLTQLKLARWWVVGGFVSEIELSWLQTHLSSTKTARNWHNRPTDLHAILHLVVGSGENQCGPSVGNHPTTRPSKKRWESFEWQLNCLFPSPMSLNPSIHGGIIEQLVGVIALFGRISSNWVGSTYNRARRWAKPDNPQPQDIAINHLTSLQLIPIAFDCLVREWVIALFLSNLICHSKSSWFDLLSC
jgi:hypothetical protein